MARPTKLNKPLIKKLCQYIADGNYLYTACRAVGIDYSNFRKWMQQADDPDAPCIYHELRDAVELAEAKAEADLVKLWLAACPDNWQAARDLLERRHRDRWGKSESLELTGKNGGPIKTQNVDDDITTLMAQLANRSEVSPALAASSQAEPVNTSR